MDLLTPRSPVLHLAPSKTGVVRFNLAAGNGGSADLWVGTAGGPVDTTVGPDASITSLTLGGIDQIALRGNVPSTLDSITFGTTALDVSGAAAVPEPSSLFVLGLGSVIGLAWRRRRNTVSATGSRP